MPTDSNGNYSLPPGYLAVTGQTVLASQHNPPLEDLGASMTNRMMRDGRTPMLGNFNLNNYRAIGAANAQAGQDLVPLSQVQAMINEVKTLIAAVQGVPTGVVIPLTGLVIPTGWVIANGQALNRLDRPALWAWVQTSGNLAASEGVKTRGQYGPGNGINTFTVPNLYADNGYFIRPLATGRTIGSVQNDDFAAHNHVANVNDPGHAHSTTAGPIVDAGGYQSGNLPIGLNTSTGGAFTGISVSLLNTGGTETRPRNVAYPVIIRT